ncbi:hypothetical protein [Companilactobacillus mishanensis]|uniref:Uncharacterized protein n=1 Tax=Companilactobacillus mishanensis TaxID=2486008 RepID=A0A5P0ZGU5_9LACO|nr:hypothetical protein [Companilactobacillus mishanensis]MQS52271.1 hypothetical protein [Companilactobacillus mishanensis]
MFSKLRSRFNGNKFNKKNNAQSLNPVVSEEDIQKQQQAIANQERQRVEQEYRKQHPDQMKEEQKLSFDHKTNKLKKRLNIAIITVFGLIVLVFLILFFV